MNEAYVNDLEYEAQSSGGLLDWLRAGADIYRTVNPPPTAQPLAPVPRSALTGQAFNWKPFAVIGGLLALVVGAVLLFRKP